MKKLFKLKSFLTLEQAAEYLTSILEEPVSVADILQLALDKRLTLSVNFVNRTKARTGKIVHYTQQEVSAFQVARNYVDDLNWVDDLHSIFTAKKNGLPPPDPVPKIMCSRHLGDNRWMTFDKIVSTLDGTWDLAMVGGELHDVAFEFHALTGGPEVTLISIDGTFVLRDGVACQLLERSERLERRQSTLDDYFPSGGLPSDSVIVVRPAALKELEASLFEQPMPTPSEDMKTLSKRTMQVVIAALCDKVGIDWMGRGAAKRLEELTEQLGAKVDQDTIKRKIIDGMREAVESRSDDKDEVSGK